MGIEQSIQPLTDRIELLEKQMKNLITHFNHLSNVAQRHEWELTKISATELARSTRNDEQA